MDILRVDCNNCMARGDGCPDCVISVLLGVPEGVQPTVELGGDEQQALAALADSGLVPPLRLVRAIDPVRDAEEQWWLGGRFAE